MQVGPGEIIFTKLFTELSKLEEGALDMTVHECNLFRGEVGPPGTVNVLSVLSRMLF